MRRSHRLITWPVLSLAAVLSASTVASQTISVVIKQPMEFHDATIEPSAIEPYSGKDYLIADDKKTQLLLVRLAKNIELSRLEIPRPANQCDQFPLPADANLRGNKDWEAMARDKDGYYYLAGSHLKRGQANPAFFSTIRFRLNRPRPNDPLSIGEVTQICLQRTLSDRATSDSLLEPQIEGLAVLEKDGEKKLIVGIREENSALVRVYWANLAAAPSLSLEPYFAFEPAKAKHVWPSAAPPVKFHLSSIEHVPNLGYLILTSTEKGNTFYGNALWLVTDAMIQHAPPKNNFRQVDPLWSRAFEEGSKAEGVYVFSDAKRQPLEAYMVFDNDFAQGTGKKSKIALVEITLKDAGSGNKPIQAPEP